MNIIFRADATPIMGTGHVMRCLALAEGLRELGHRCVFLVAEITPAIETRLRAADIGIRRMVEDEQGAATLRAAAELGAHALVVDGYQFGSAWRCAARAFRGPILSFSDDIAHGVEAADIVLDAAGDPADERRIKGAPDARWLLGGDYTLLRRELREALAAPRIPLLERRSILVNFGGSDLLRLTLPVAATLREQLGRSTELDIIIGGSVPKGSQVAHEAGRLGEGVRVHLDPPNLGTLFARAGLAVSAAGVTSREIAAFAVPLIVAIVADNQVSGAQRLAARQCGVVLDGRAQGAGPQIAATAAALWKDPARRLIMSERAAGMIDGQGVRRVCAALLEAISSKH